MEKNKESIDASAEHKEPAGWNDVFGIYDGADDIKALELELISMCDERDQIIKHLHQLKAEAYKDVQKRYANARKINDEAAVLYLCDKDIRMFEAEELLIQNEEYQRTLRDSEDYRITIEMCEIQLRYLTRRFQATLPILQQRILMRTEQWMAEHIGDLPPHGTELAGIVGDENSEVHVQAATGTFDEMIELLQREKRKRDNKQGRNAGTAAGDVQYT